jgi:AcrR family transcriptional regulator
MATTANGSTTRRNILETARSLFKQRGFDQTSLRDITDRLALTETDIAAYFGSKDDLLEAVWSE